MQLSQCELVMVRALQLFGNGLDKKILEVTNITVSNFKRM